MSKKGYRPQRTCMGCGKRDDQNQLIRLALTEKGGLMVDGKTGRGGYLHRSLDCWRAFLGRKGQYRTFHVEITRATKEQLVNKLVDRDWE
ncbi:MAG: YlxR family protein [Candidatus Binatia bacterium]